MAMPAAMALTFDDARHEPAHGRGHQAGGTQAIGALLGPLLGGAALVTFGWHAAFWSVALMLALALVLNILLPRDQPLPRRPLDSVGRLSPPCPAWRSCTRRSAPRPPGHVDLVAVAVGVPAPWHVGVVGTARGPSVVRAGDRAAADVPSAHAGGVHGPVHPRRAAVPQHAVCAVGARVLRLERGLFLMPALLMWTASASTAGSPRNGSGLAT